MGKSGATAVARALMIPKNAEAVDTVGTVIIDSIPHQRMKHNRHNITAQNKTKQGIFNAT